jgi:DNA mismatch repair protein MutH
VGRAINYLSGLIVRDCSFMFRKKNTLVDEQPKKRNLWVVQLIEYILGLGTGAATVNAGQPLGVALVAIMIVSNAAFLNAPLSAFRVTQARAHQLLGIVIAVVSVVIAVIIPMDVSSQLIVIAVAVAQGFLSVRFGNGF